jgi:hypothetical protein
MHTKIIVITAIYQASLARSFVQGFANCLMRNCLEQMTSVQSG